MITKLRSDEHPYTRRMRMINKAIDAAKLVLVIAVAGYVIYRIVR